MATVMSRKPLPLQSFKLGLLLSDLGALWLCFHMAYWIRFEGAPPYAFHYPDLILVGLIVGFTGYILDVFDVSGKLLGIRSWARFGLSTVLAAGLVSLYLYISATKASNVFGRGVMFMALSAFAVWGIALRIGVGKWVEKQERFIRWLAIGRPEKLSSFWQDLTGAGIEGQVSALVPERQRLSDEPAFKKISVVGDYRELDYWLLKGWSGIVVCEDQDLPEDVVEKLLSARLHGLRIYNLTDFYEEVWEKVPVFFLSRSWLLLSQGFGLLHNRLGLRFKSVCDFLGALILLPIAVPLIAIAGFFILVESGWPIIFAQTRTGKNGQPFTLYKLRTMRKDAEARGAQWAQKNDDRVLWIGKYLRKFRVDELPQLWNVLKGEMSFIGPRPERPEFNSMLEGEIPHYSLRHSVRPGITGWAQVLYDYGASVEDAQRKLEYELYYIKNYSIFLDLKIVLKTMRKMLVGAGR